MDTSLQVGDIEICWLPGGEFRLDGGAMFGPVPKALWSARYPCADDNTIRMCNDPLLVRTPESAVIVDTGLGNKLGPKAQRIYQLDPPWGVPAALERIGMDRRKIEHVVLTHCDFDHAGGIEFINQHGERELTFPEATHYIQRREWEDVCNPDERAAATYLPENFALLAEKGRLRLLDGACEICKGVNVFYSGGHTRGHQIVEVCSRGEVAVHLGDLLPTKAHTRPLWVMAYDNFPLEVIEQKKHFYKKYSQGPCWYTFYHDPAVRFCRLDGTYRPVDESGQVG